MKYKEFLEKKVKSLIYSGFEINDSDLNDKLFEFQKFIVKRALKAGKYAIFADCGLGKTFMQLEWAFQVSKFTSKKVLILAPLAVVDQTIQQSKVFGIDMSNIDVSNYEQLENIDTESYSGVVLDESSILKNFEGETKKKLIEKFANTPYKLACTATPSPNDPMELGNHSEFLDVMKRNEMLAMYFIHDGGETSKWRLKGHAQDRFYGFVASWSIMLNKPSDIGFDMQGYSLPELNIIENQIKTSKRENGLLFNESVISATTFNSELRSTMIDRMNEVVSIIESNPNENFIIWVKHNEEGEYLRKILANSVEVKGSDTPEFKKKNLLGFANNEFRILITKTKIASFGMNYQNCNNQIFASLDFSFESLYQAIRRSYRFGQKNKVNIYLITTDTMANVKHSIDKKQKQFEIMQNEMSKSVNKNLSGSELKDSVYNTDSVSNENYSIFRGDCVQVINRIESESIGLSVFSPPFAELYTYSSHLEDMGNSKDYKEFLTQFSFLIKELHRVMITGRNVCVHCMDLPIQKGKEGFIGLRDFSGMIREAFENEGFIYHSRITIWKDPVVEMQRTKALGLLHKQVKKDSTMSRVGIPDYVLVFRKDGERLNPVSNKDISVDLWQQYASPVWDFKDLEKEFEMIVPLLSESAYNELPKKILSKYSMPVWDDINYSNTLQGFREGRESNDEKHICPLQLDTIERLIHLYSNKGDKVFTPFMGIGSEVYQAIKMNRIGIGIELKESYYHLAKRNAKIAMDNKKQLSIF